MHTPSHSVGHSDTQRAATTRRASDTQWMAFAALAVAGSLWGTGFFFGKIALSKLSVGHMVLYRFLFACLGFLPVVLRHRVAIRRDDFPFFLAAGALGVPIQFLIQFAGLARTTVSHASLMIGVLPMLLALGATLFSGDRLHWRGWLTLVGSSAGAALIVFGSRTYHAQSTGGPTLIGDALVAGSLFAGVGWILLSKRLMEARHGYSSVIVSAYVFMLGSVMLGGWVLLTEGPPPVTLSVAVWIALAVQGVLATTATTLLWNWALKRVPASRAAVFINLEPLVGSILGVTLLHEVLGPVALFGGALIISAAFLSSRDAGASNKFVYE